VQLLRLDKSHKVLEIGTGTGYQTALIAKLARRVYSIDRYKELVLDAEAAWQHLGIPNITAIAGDGLCDWQAQAPFDRIIVCAALSEIIPQLAEQLSIGGMLLAPVGEAGKPQHLVRWQRVEGGWIEDVLRGVRFVGCVSGLLTSIDKKEETLSA
jgi:protein-L-isoaspartate(D-aspartate) O-methyltransferase